MPISGPRSLRTVGKPSVLVTQRQRIKGVTANAAVLTPLSPLSASQAPAAIYSMRKVVPGYAGSVLQGRNSANTLSTIGFDANGVVSDAQIAAAVTAGDGSTYTTATLYDQTANARNLTSSSRPNVARSALTSRDGYSIAGIDYNNKTHNMVTAAAFADFSAGKNVAVFMVMGTDGYSSATSPFADPGVSGVYGPALGYGTTTAGALVTGAANANGETTFGAAISGTVLDSDTTFTNGRVRNLWYNWKDGKLSGGADIRQAFADRAIAAPLTGGPHRLVLGNHGGLQQAHNGKLYEIIVFCTDAPLSDIECQRIALWQRQFWGDLGAARIPLPFDFFMGGQSLGQYYGTSASASTLAAADFADVRVFRPELIGYLGADIDTTKTLTSTFNTSAIGGSSLLAGSSMTPDNSGAWAPYDGVTTAKKFWWDQFNNIPGPCAQTWKANTVKGGLPFDNLVMGWSQGEADATIMSGLADDAARATYTATYKPALKSLFAQMRTWAGQQAPILIQPLGRQNGTDVPMRTLRRVQAEVAAEVSGIFIGAETTHFTRQDAVHFAAGPVDPNGFDRGAHQLARANADIMLAGGSGANRKWKGPRISGATKVNTTTIDVTLAYPAQSGGTDFTPTTSIVGFEVTDIGGAKVITSAVRQSANTIRLTLSTALSGTTTLQYNTAPSGLDRTLMVVDNTSGLPLPLEQAFDVVVQ